MVIIGLGAVSQIVPVVEWGYLLPPAMTPLRWGVTALGALLVIGGLAFRVWSIRYLGQFFTTTVRTTDTQRLVTSGPYGLVRHPSYLGAWLAVVGSALFLNAPVGTVVAAVAMLAAYVYRIRAEEVTLEAFFEDDYRAYRKATRFGLFPGLW